MHDQNFSPLAAAFVGKTTAANKLQSQVTSGALPPTNKAAEAQDAIIAKLCQYERKN